DPRTTDLLSGAGLAALIGLPGLGLYVVARYLGISVTIAPANPAAVWWAVPVPILAAARNAILGEVAGGGYPSTRRPTAGRRPAAAVATHALLRGSYHLYQGLGGFLGNAVMGAVFALFYLRFRRVMPLVVAHALIDVVAFVGYGLFREEADAALASLLDWLPSR